MLVTTGEAATLAHVEPATIRRWKARDKLRPVGVRPDGASLYRLADVFEINRGEDPRTHWRKTGS